MTKVTRTKTEQLDDIRAGLREAQRGDFASDTKVAATIAKCSKRSKAPHGLPDRGPPARS
jgi:hypothetical protein